jgi:hypothetical protein
VRFRAPLQPSTEFVVDHKRIKQILLQITTAVSRKKLKQNRFLSLRCQHDVIIASINAQRTTRRISIVFIAAKIATKKPT